MDKKGISESMGLIIGIVVALVVIGVSIYLIYTNSQKAQDATETLTGCGGSGLFPSGICKNYCDEELYQYGVGSLCEAEGEQCCIPKEEVSGLAQAYFEETLGLLSDCKKEEDGEAKCDQATKLLQQKVLTKDTITISFMKSGENQNVKYRVSGNEVSEANIAFVLSACVEGEGGDNTYTMSFDEDTKDITTERTGDATFQGFEKGYDGWPDDTVCAVFE